MGKQNKNAGRNRRPPKAEAYTEDTGVRMRQSEMMDSQKMKINHGDHRASRDN
jgi:hypothetical protein